jgi:hypothetical protein
LWVAHPKFAPQRIVVPKSGDELADVRLQPGTQVSGTVRDENGLPAPGVVVVADSVDDGTLTNVGFSVELAAKTDSQGRYELPPLDGMYRVYLADVGERNDHLADEFIVAETQPPLVEPKKISVSGTGTRKLDFQSKGSLLVRGIVRWPDGKPAVGCEVKASYMPQDFGGGIWIGQTWTDEDGKYVIPLPDAIENVSICAFGDFDAKRKWHYAHPSDNVKAKNKSMQFIALEPLNSDLDGIDWVLKADTN